MHGVLLYGINSSGKSSPMKAIGIAVIMAKLDFMYQQIHEIFYFDAVYTRISGVIILQKVYHHFAVEMLELKNIFNRATKKFLWF